MTVKVMKHTYNYDHIIILCVVSALWAVAVEFLKSDSASVKHIIFSTIVSVCLCLFVTVILEELHLLEYLLGFLKINTDSINLANYAVGAFIGSMGQNGYNLITGRFSTLVKGDTHD